MDRQQTLTTESAADRSAGRPLRALGALLTLQALALAGLGLFELRGLGSASDLSPEPLLGGAPEALALALLLPATVLMGASGLLFLFGSRRCWTPAALSQGLALAAGLWLYATSAPYYTYVVLASCIPLVLFLNSQSVRGLLHAGDAASPDRSGGVV